MPADENVDSEEGPDWLSHEDNDLTSKKEESVYLHTHTHTTVNRLTAFCSDYPGRPVPEETFTHSHPSWSSESGISLFTEIKSWLQS